MQNFRHVAEAKPKACLPKQQPGKRNVNNIRFILICNVKVTCRPYLTDGAPTIGTEQDRSDPGFQVNLEAYLNYLFSGKLGNYRQ